MQGIEKSQENNQINNKELKNSDSKADDNASFYVRSMIKIFDPENGKIIVEKTN